VDEILRSLRQGAVVLDLGSGPGSLETAGYGVLHIKADLEPQGALAGRFVQADASNLPFKASVFDAILCNHSLEHFPDLFRSLGEIGRVLKSNGVLYISVPFSESVTDRLYRWLSEGGGHVNQFKSADEVERIVARSTGLPLIAMRPLCTSLSFLNPANSPRPRPRKLLFLLNGYEPFLRLLTFVLRMLDRTFGTKNSLYGWAFYFGAPKDSIDTQVWTNVCVRCGAGHPELALRRSGLVKARRLLPSIYRCPRCDARNFFTADDIGLH
jgi:SAM-dependent methyltransferase